MKLTELYARIPGIECQGKCAESCGPIVVGERELARMMAASGGRPLTFDHEATCGYLKDGRCTVYEVRPMICRLWGVVPEMTCPWGCKVERVLSRPEAATLFRTLERVGGRRCMPKEVDERNS